MSRTEPPAGFRWSVFHRIRPGTWVALALLAGASPWVAMLASGLEGHP